MNDSESRQENYSPAVSPAAVAAWIYEGTRLLNEGKTGDALPLLQKAYDADPNNFDATLNLSSAFILSNRFKKAVPLLETLSAAYPDNAQVWTNLGAAYLGNPVLATDEQQEKAIAAFKQALAINPVAFSVAYNIGLVQLDRRDHDEAKKWFRLAIQHNPRDQHARSHLRRLEQQDE